MIPELLCAFSQTGSDFVDFGNSIRDGLLGTNSDPDGTASGYGSAIQRGLCGLGTPPANISFDAPPAILPGSCNAAYRLRAFVTYLPAAGGPEVTEFFGANDPNTYTGPLGDSFITGNSGERSFIRFTNTNGFILGPFFRGPLPTYQLALERVDGQPDNCGADGQPVPDEQPVAPSGSGDVTFEDDTGTTVTEPFTFSFGFPFISPGGDVIVPVEICLYDFCVQLCYNVNTGEIQTCGSNQPNDPCCPTVDQIDGEPSEDEPPPPESDVRYAGVLVRVTNPTANPRLTRYGNQGPELIIPKMATVRFAIELGGRRMWTGDQFIKTVPQGVFVNAPAFAYDWDIIFEGNLTGEVTGIVAPASVVP